MATVDLTDVRPNGNSFAEVRLSPPRRALGGPASGPNWG